MECDEVVAPERRIMQTVCVRSFFERTGRPAIVAELGRPVDGDRISEMARGSKGQIGVESRADSGERLSSGVGAGGGIDASVCHESDGINAGTSGEKY